MSSSTPLAAPAECDDARIDAAGLRQAREQRGLSVSEAARWLTLSKSQIQQIEGGGFTAFYSPAHKALAVRKYASAIGLDPDAVLGLGVKLAGPSSPAAGEGDVPAEESAASAPAGASENVSEGIPENLAENVPENEAACRMPEDEARGPAPLAMSVPAPRARPVASDVHAPAKSLVLGVLLFCAAAIAFAIIRGSVERFVALPVPPVAVPANPAPASAGPAPVARPNELTAAVTQPSLGTGCTAAPSGASTPTWIPSYVRKPGTRLHIGGPTGTEVCVSDSVGKVSRLVLKAGTMQSIDGRPPYLVQSASLGVLQMFMQGLKVKVPAQSASIQLMPGERMAAPETDTAELAPAS